MYTYKLALLVLAATAAHAYPVASKNLKSLALVAARRIPRIIEDDPRAERRQIHNADYQANSPRQARVTAPAQDESSLSPAKPAPSEPVPKDKRQIHNPDYQANGPPPSPNHGPAQDESSPPSPANAAPSEPASKDKRRTIKRIRPPPSPNHGPSQDESSPANPPAAAPSSQSAPKDKRALFEHTSASSIPIPSRVDKSSIVMKKRSMAMGLGGADTLAAANLVTTALRNSCPASPRASGTTAGADATSRS
ncbi:hypothetical protein B0H14DRAFT_30370 [Mycena olivaceomarginata]|nr:hypothetical protein B0H14DRAFT_30370 [Mycena olivaceomarginata]